MDRMVKPERNTVVVLAIVLLIGCVIGAVGFVLGRDSSEPAQAGSVVRTAQTEAVAKARKAGYKRGFADGRKAAERRGETRTGRDDSHGAGRDDSHGAGRDALAVDDFALGAGYYVVHTDGDGRATEYAPMQQGYTYFLCEAYDVCRRTP